MEAPRARLTLGKASSAPSAAQALALKASSSPHAAPAAPQTSSFPRAAGLPTLTMSSCTPDMAEGSHLFDVHLYGSLENLPLGVGKSVTSGPFDVGGHTWALLFFPAGSEAASGGQRHVSVYLELMTPHVEVLALFDLRLLEQSTGRWHSLFDHGGVDNGRRRQAVFSTFPNKRPLHQHHPPRCWGVPSWKATDLDTPKYIKNGSLAIMCDITVVKPPRVSETKRLTQIEPPPPGLSKDLGRLLEEKDGKDVTVRVGGEAFTAHRTMLAARSPVLRKKLLDATDGTKPSSVEITMDQDMEPAVFKAMLHFIYTDELPPGAEGRGDGGDKAAEFVQRLIIAAEGCGIERLKGLCESLLCRNINKRTVEATMEFAGRHHCHKLRAACVAVLDNLKRGLEGARDFEACKRLKKN